MDTNAPNNPTNEQSDDGVESLENLKKLFDSSPSVNLTGSNFAATEERDLDLMKPPVTTMSLAPETSVAKAPETDLMNTPDTTQEINTNDSVNIPSEINETKETNETNKTNEINQTDQTNEINQINPINKVASDVPINPDNSMTPEVPVTPNAPANNIVLASSNGGNDTKVPVDSASQDSTKESRKSMYIYMAIGFIMIFLLLACCIFAVIGFSRVIGDATNASNGNGAQTQTTDRANSPANTDNVSENNGSLELASTLSQVEVNKTITLGSMEFTAKSVNQSGNRSIWAVSIKNTGESSLRISPLVITDLANASGDRYILNTTSSNELRRDVSPGEEINGNIVYNLFDEPRVLKLIVFNPEQLTNAQSIEVNLVNGEITVI